jgi:L-aminopeptidase/D-esterase-like protein
MAADSPTVVRPGPTNSLTDVTGLAVGHHHRIGERWLTGTTVVLSPPGTTGGIDVRGGGASISDTACLDPTAMVPHVDAICLSGGSAYGLAAADGVRAWLERRRTGFQVGPERHHVVPIVPAAVVFDLGAGGRFGNRPTPAFGRSAAAAAADGAVVAGSVGAGAGTHAGPLKGGVGSASAVLPTGVTVAALVVVNSAGSPVDPATGRLWGADRGLPGEFATRRPSAAEARAYRELPRGPRPLNTTLAVVATDAALTKPECTRLAGAAHDGMARAIDPIHQYVDGDVAFALATGGRQLQPAEGPTTYQATDNRFALLGLLFAAAADAVARAIVHAVLAAEPAGPWVSYREQFPSAFR